ncbi:MAG: hypothetical protein QHC90_25745 [Shinella sp.]|nr:hypothetical protein [Shinella sp.]
MTHITPASRISGDLENHIRRRVTAGARIAEIAAETGFTITEMEQYVGNRKPRWRLEDEARRRAGERGHIVVFKPFRRKSGGYDIRPITLPGISMYIAAQKEAER